MFGFIWSIHFLSFVSFTTSAPLFPSIAAVIVAPMVSTARRIGSASRCAYLAVVAACLCPSSFPMIGSPIDAPAPMLAKL